MSTPVTRGELRFELAQLELRLDETLAQLDQMVNARLKELVTKTELKNVATKADLETWGGALMERMAAEFARHARVFQELTQARISAIDENYADLAGRVSRLEAKVFAPRRR